MGYWCDLSLSVALFLERRVVSMWTSDEMVGVRADENLGARGEVIW